MNKGVFLDKDGTLVYNVPYNVNVENIKLYEDVSKALRLLQENGFKLIVITNQPGVALGYFEEEGVKNVGHALTEMLNSMDIKLDGFYYCPHHEEGMVKEYSIKCSCRKPQPGLIKKAAEEFSIDLTKSWMIGDILHDVEAGNRAGCKTILINNGNETEWVFTKSRVPDYTVKTLKAAANKIVKDSKAERGKGGVYEGISQKFGREIQ